MDDVIFLLENDEETIRDIKWSLAPLSVAIENFSSVDAVLKAIDSHHPRCIITRMLLGESSVVGMVLLEKLLTQGCSIPVVAACTNSELSYVDKRAGLFTGIVTLPVEFPRFTEVIKEVLAGASADGMKQLPEQRSVPLPSPDDKVRVMFPERSSNDQLNRNVLLVYQIHHLVLKELESQHAFSGLMPHQVPAIILDITRKVCGKVNLEGVHKLIVKEQ